ncbi:MAG: hypothetical protein V4580_02075 [Bacteroidota bacterium]
MANIKKGTDDSFIIVAIVAFFVVLIAIIWGNYDKKSQVLSPKLKSLLSDDDNAKALLDAIQKEKSGENKTPEFLMGGKKYKIERSGKKHLLEA